MPLPISSLPAAAPETGEAPLALKSFSYEDRREILPALAEAMTECGCWLRDRKTVSLSQMEYSFEVQLRSAFELYSGLIGCGLELTRASHLELTGLCMLRQHNPRPSELGRVVNVRLEVSFLEDLDMEPAAAACFA
jgi:hypothetical protein